MQGGFIGSVLQTFSGAMSSEALLPELSRRERVMVLMDGITGFRRGELIALRWADIDFELSQANVTHAIWNNVEGDVKTEASRKPVPIPQMVIEELETMAVG
jgi:integrase